MFAAQLNFFAQMNTAIHVSAQLNFYAQMNTAVHVYSTVEVSS